MKALDKLAHAQNRRDDTLNQKLARELAEGKNPGDIREIVENLQNKELDSSLKCNRDYLRIPQES